MASGTYRLFKPPTHHAVMDTMATLRTFIAVDATAAIRKRACQLIERLQSTPAKVKWVGATELHWTLKFLGDVQTREIPRVCDAVSAAVADLSTFEIEAGGAGAFPTAQRPRTLWLGVGQGESKFVELHERIEAALAPLGFREEQRRFRPHMTLGRVRRSLDGISELGGLVAQHHAFAAGQMAVSEVVVFSSRLERRGPVYEVLGRAPLGCIPHFASEAGVVRTVRAGTHAVPCMPLLSRRDSRK